MQHFLKTTLRCHFKDTHLYSHRIYILRFFNLSPQYADETIYAKLYYRHAPLLFQTTSGQENRRIIQTLYLRFNYFQKLLPPKTHTTVHSTLDVKFPKLAYMSLFTAGQTELVESQPCFFYNKSPESFQNS
jgi:hypothetical protein